LFREVEMQLELLDAVFAQTNLRHSQPEEEPLPQRYLWSARTPRLPYEYDRQYLYREQMRDLLQDHLQVCERLE
jgi:hypothetical protein